MKTKKRPIKKLKQKKVKKHETVKTKKIPKRTPKFDDRMISPILETRVKHLKQQKSAEIKRPRKKSNAQHYVDPKELNSRIEAYYRSGESIVKDEELAMMISKIAHRLAFAPNFINYSYREDFVGDAIIKMFSALKNKKFKINKGYNPFSYFTKIAFNAFCNRIKKEKRSHEALAAYQTEVYDNLLAHGHVSNKGNNDNPTTEDL